VKKILETMHSEIHGMVHCSGGGQTKILHFIDNLNVVKDNLFPLPPLFRIIHEQSGTDWREMYQVFNMGHRFEIYTDQKNAAEIISIAAEFNLEARIIGHCEEGEGRKLTIKSEYGTFEY
jgi:phosphoribosylformylglycinamidine cyclo-ligase